MDRSFASDSEVQTAQELAGRLLSGNRERLAHSTGVADRAEFFSAGVGRARRAELMAAAWLHDIGYSEAVQQSGFHPVDGARYLRMNGWRPEVCNAVAHHSGSRFVAVVRRLEPDLAEFTFTEDDVSDALTVADQTVGPGGVPMTFTERIADMLRRHGADSPNALAHARRGPYLLAAAHRVKARCAVRASRQSGTTSSRRKLMTEHGPREASHIEREAAHQQPSADRPASIPPVDRNASGTAQRLGLGEVYQLILRQVQHEVWDRRGRGDSAEAIADDLGVGLERVHTWFVEWGARQEAAFNRSRPTGDLVLRFSAAGCEVDDLGLTWPEQP